MKPHRLFLLATSVVVFLLAGCSTAPTAEVNSPPAATVSPADPRFRYEGRFDFSDPNAPVVIWQASRICLDFEGDTLGLSFDGAKGQSFFNADVDGSTMIVEVREGSLPRGATISGLGRGRHHLVVHHI